MAISLQLRHAHDNRIVPLIPRQIHNPTDSISVTQFNKDDEVLWIMDGSAIQQSITKCVSNGNMIAKITTSLRLDVSEHFRIRPLLRLPANLSIQVKSTTQNPLRTVNSLEDDVPIKMTKSESRHTQTNEKHSDKAAHKQNPENLDSRLQPTRHFRQQSQLPLKGKFTNQSIQPQASFLLDAQSIQVSNGQLLPNLDY
jgi:hypothetical protein